MNLTKIYNLLRLGLSVIHKGNLSLIRLSLFSNWLPELPLTVRLLGGLLVNHRHNSGFFNVYNTRRLQ